MMATIPLSALELGINHKRYEELARNIGRMKLITLEQRKSIIEEADEKLPINLFPTITRLLEDMFYDREVFKIAEIPYHKGPPKNEKLFITAVADYLLRERPFESRRGSE